MKILVTGGSGFIGKNLISNLKYNNLEVYNYDIKKKLDIRKLEQINSYMKINKPHIVVHLATRSLLRESVKDIKVDAETNIMGSINVLEACKNNNVRRIIYTSTGGARYGVTKKSVKEEEKLLPISSYGISKHTVEHYLDFYHRFYGLNYTTLCFSNVISGKYTLKNKCIIGILIHKIINEEVITIFGNGSQKKDFIHVDDVVDMMVKIIRCDFFVNELYNLSFGRSFSLLEVVDCIERITGKIAKIKFVKKNKFEIPETNINSDKAIRELKWAPTHFIDNLIKSVYEYLNNRNE